MRSETDVKANMLERQLEHDRDMRAIERLHVLIAQGAKGLSLLGGGAAVGVLAFIQALIDKTAFSVFKPYAILSLCCFLVSAFLPAIVFFFHFGYLNRPYAEKREKQLDIVWWLLGTASVLLLLGGIIVTLGVLYAL